MSHFSYKVINCIPRYTRSVNIVYLTYDKCSLYSVEFYDCTWLTSIEYTGCYVSMVLCG